MLQRPQSRALKRSRPAGEVKVLENSQETLAHSRRTNTLGQEAKTSGWGSLKVVSMIQVVFVVSSGNITLCGGAGGQ